jgi:hypothetical protein
MNSEKQPLPDFAVAALYKNLLIESNGIAHSRQHEVRIAFLGSNRKKICIVVNSPDTAFLPGDHLQFLDKILLACKIALDDVAIVNQAGTSITIEDLREQFSPKSIILFGIPPADLGLPLNFPHFKIQEYADATYLFTPPLDILNQQTEHGKSLKREFWSSLKNLFGI